MYLSGGTLPDLQKGARKRLLQSSDFLLIGNVLFHSRVAKAKLTKDMNQFQLVLPQCTIVDVLHLYHYSPLTQLTQNNTKSAIAAYPTPY